MSRWFPPDLPTWTSPRRGILGLPGSGQLPRPTSETGPNGGNLAAGDNPRNWEAQKTNIAHLYLDKNLPLRVVLSRMRDLHGFRATYVFL